MYLCSHRTGKVGASSSEPAQSLDGLLSAQHLWQQAEQAGLSFDGLGNQPFLGNSLSQTQQQQQLGSAGSGDGINGAPVRFGSLGSSGMGSGTIGSPGGRQPLPPQHTQHSSLSMGGAAAQCE